MAINEKAGSKYVPAVFPLGKNIIPSRCFLRLQELYPCSRVFLHTNEHGGKDAPDLL
jgi:hypothetical protein